MRNKNKFYSFYSALRTPHSALILYSLLLTLLLPFVLLRLLWKSKALPAYRYRWRERLGLSSRPIPTHGIWIHAVSLGEVNAAAPLITAIQQRSPTQSILVTTTTPTGSARIQHLFGKTISHCYMPYDLPFVLGPFLKKVNPRLVLILETEIWPNLIHLCAKRYIPLLILNARLSEKSATRYRWVKRFFSDILNKITHIAAQSEQDAKKFLSLGILPKRLSVVGNLKFDCSLPCDLSPQAQKLKSIFEQRSIWIAASTHEGEEIILLEAFRKIKSTIPDVLLILAPRHPERFESVYRQCQEQNFNVSLLTKIKGGEGTTQRQDILLADTIGDLPSLYGISDIAFVGGSLVPHGGHNILEPALWKLPIVTGPYTVNFREIVRLFLEQEALQIVKDAGSLAAIITHLLQNPTERKRLGEQTSAIVEQNRGALQKTMRILEVYLR